MTPYTNSSTCSIWSGRSMWTGASRWPPRFASSPWVGTPWRPRRAKRDNEPTGLFVGNGSTRKEELVGTRKSLDDARGFFTMQHGQNSVFEVLRKDVIVAKK